MTGVNPSEKRTMPEVHPALAKQFDSLEQQRNASEIGMWTFLATEIMFFGGLFLAYMVFRHAYPQAFAEGSRHTLVLYGTINTAILLTSSLTMALAVHSAQTSDIKWLVRFLIITALLGLAFLAVKGLEYREDIKEHMLPGYHFELPPKAELFWFLYWAMTGLHAIHVTVGVALIGIMAFLSSRRRYSAAHHTPIEMVGLYWHFVDIVWVFLYPMLYLIDLK